MGSYMCYLLYVIYILLYQQKYVKIWMLLIYTDSAQWKCEFHYKNTLLNSWIVEQLF